MESIVGMVVVAGPVAVHTALEEGVVAVAVEAAARAHSAAKEADASTYSLAILRSRSSEILAIPDFCHSSCVADTVAVATVVDQASTVMMVLAVDHSRKYGVVTALAEPEPATRLRMRSGIAGSEHVAEIANVRVAVAVRAVRPVSYFLKTPAEAISPQPVLPVLEVAAVAHLKLAFLRVQDFSLPASAVAEAAQGFG